MNEYIKYTRINKYIYINILDNFGDLIWEQVGARLGICTLPDKIVFGTK